MELPENVKTLRSLLPVLEEKCKQGLIQNNLHLKAVSLCNAAERYTLTPKQMLFVGKLIRYANRRHRGAAPVAVADTGDIIAKVMLQVEQQIGAKTGIDVDKLVSTVSARVLADMEKRVPREVKITVERADGKQYKVKGPQHSQFKKLLDAATTRLPHGYAPGIFLQGEASSGKTTGARMLAEALGLDWYFNGAISFPHEMLGFIDGAGKYHRTPFRDAYEFGGVYTFDEVDRSDPNALLAVNPHLANGIATFPDKQVKRHKNCIIVCTANTWGLGGDNNYSGATKLDAAFLSRFEVRINWDIDTKLEDEIVGHPEWLAMVRAARSKARANGLKVLIDTRAALAGAALINQKGYSLGDAADATYLANLKPDQRKQVLL